MSYRSLVTILALGALWPAGPALAQAGADVQKPGTLEAQPFDPSNDDLDRQLDESLREEFEAQERAAPPPRRRAAPAPVDPDLDPPPSRRDLKEADDWRLRLRGVGAHYATMLRDVEVAYREGVTGGERIEFDRDLGEFDLEHSQLYQGRIELGRWVQLTGGFWRTVYRDNMQANRSLTFGRVTYQQGDLVESVVDLRTADLGLAVTPVNGRYVTFGIHLGARYMYWETRLKTPFGSALNEEESRIETVVPMFGLELAVRPIQEVEFFARGRIGGFEYERDEEIRIDRNGNVDRVSFKRREAAAAEVDAGITFLFFDTIGFVVAYRFDYYELERTTVDRREEAQGLSHGAYGGLVLDF